GLMGKTALAAMQAGFNQFFSVIPGPAPAGHGDGYKQPGHDRTDQQTADQAGGDTGAQPVTYRHQQNRHYNWQQRRGNHLPDGRFGNYIHGLAVFGFGLAAHNALDFFELPPNFLYHADSRPTHGLHT